ncbi:MAG: hypothetical protein H0U75_09080 [Legionella sp.]|nr:hypothetical protein [Legionella sp.]
MNNYNEMPSTDELAKKGLHEAKKSGEDWLKYVEQHPLQSMVFGAVILYAIKGLFK